MGCPQCQHENHPGAKFCEECGWVLPRLWPQATIGFRDVGRPRRTERPTMGREIAAAIGVVVPGVALIAGIIIVSPGWQRIIAAWRQGAAARSAMMAPAIEAAARELPGPTAVAPGMTTLLAPSSAPAQLAPVTPARPQDSGRLTDRPRTSAPSDTAQVMASLLISQLGQDPAWRTALANADAHAADSPEHAYWRSVATAIRDGGHRSRQ